MPTHHLNSKEIPPEVVKLDLLDLLLVIAKYKNFIILSLIVGLIGSIAFLLLTKERPASNVENYISRSVLFTTDVHKLKAVLMSRRLLLETIRDKELTSRLFLSQHPKGDIKSIENLDQYVYMKLRKNLEVTTDKDASNISVSFRWHDRSSAQWVLFEILDELTKVVNEIQTRNEARQKKALENILFIEGGQREKKLAALLSIALQHNIFTFEVFDPPSPAEHSPLQKRNVPFYLIGIPFLMVLGSVLTAFFMEYMKALIEENPGKYSLILKYMGRK